MPKFSVRRSLTRQSSWKYVANCFIGMFADASPSLTVTSEIGPLTSLVMWVLNTAPLPVLKVMNRRGSLMKFTPVLKSWPRPPPPLLCHEKSSRNWYLVCSVVWGVLALAPMVKPFGNNSFAADDRDAMLLAKFAYWKMNSFSFDPPSPQLWFRLIELYLFVLSPQFSKLLLGAALYGCELVSRP